ncbi:MAG: nucleotide exchange factor GrpE [Armatimonadetes bacterium]|nr:nucleotide exchange factor GrpE [Armatimonadota bacterium]
MTRRIKIQGKDSEEEMPNLTPAEATGAPGEAPADSAEEEAARLCQEIETLKARLEEKEGQLAAKEQESAENYNKFLRAVADLENYRKRSRQEMEEVRQFCNQEMILTILPLVDDFERALQAAETNPNFEALDAGVKLILKKFADTLQKLGVKPIEAVGQPFDPMKHEAVLQVSSSDHPDNTVVEELRKGYVLNDRVIRPTMVQVSQKD